MKKILNCLGIFFLAHCLFAEEIPENVIVKEENSALQAEKIFVENDSPLNFSFKGDGWIYLGEFEAGQHLVYKSKTVSDGNTHFLLLAKQEGETKIRFYKKDVITGTYIENNLTVFVLPKSKEVAKTLNESETVSQTTENSESSEKNSPSNTEENSLNESDSSADSNLELAKESITDGDYAKALSYLNTFLSVISENTDEGLYLKAQILESPSEIRNIKEATQIYYTLVENYPQSKYWENARERYIYLQKFYFGLQ